MGARGNSGVILSQIVRGAAEELASRPGELVDPILVAAAFARAADAAYDSVREPAEGTMLTVFREMAHSLSRQLAHLDADKQRLGRDVSEDEQDAVLAEVLERAIEDGERAVARTPEQLEVLRESGVVDAGGHGLVLILAGVVAGLRGDGEAARGPAPRAAAPQPAPPRGQPLPLLHQLHRLRQRPRNREFLPRLEGLGDSVLVVGDDATLKVHVHTDEPEAAVALFDGVGEVTNLDVADMREQMAERDARLGAAGRTGVVAVAAGDGLQRLFGELGAHVVPGGETLNPSTYELLAGIHSVAAEEVLVLPSSSNVMMAAERACELSEKPARVVPATSQQASLLALVELDPEASLEENAERLEAALEGVATGGVAPAARDDAQGRFKQGRRGRLRRRRDRRLGRRRLDPDRDDPAPRRGGRDRHRDRRRGSADPARGDRHPRPRRGRDRDPRGGTAELVVAAGRPVALRSFAGARELSRGRAARRPRPLAAPERPRRRACRRSTGVGPKTGRGGRRSRHPHRRRPALPRPAAATATAQCASWASSSRARPATVLVEVLGSQPRPFRKGRLTHGQRQSRRRERPRARHLVQPALGGREARHRAPSCC